MDNLKVDIRLHRPGFSLVVNEEFPVGITGIFGHSGAGKSTLLYCISGIQKPTDGSINCNGQTLYSPGKKTNMPVFKRHIGYVFQEGRLFPHLTVKNNLLYSGRATGCKNNPEEFKNVVEMLNIGALLKKYPSRLSGGECQRVALGRVLLMNPRVLLLDEPFSALDKNLRKQIVPYISEVSQKLKVPVLVVSHDLSDLLKLTHRLCILSKGIIHGHDDYEVLILNKELMKTIPASDVINVIDLKIVDIDISSGMIQLNGFGEGRKVKITFEPGKMDYQEGAIMRVFLRPDDIVLSYKMVDGTTFRNQIKGEIKYLIEEGPRVLCMVDCGFPLLAQVSRQAVKELGLKPGSFIYCLFKSLALDSIPV